MIIVRRGEIQNKGDYMKSKLLGYLLLSGVVVFVTLFCFAYFAPKHGISKCVVNLQNIEDCKALWGDNRDATVTNSVPSWEDLRSYFPPSWSNTIPVCPDGGTYTLGRIGEPPTCSIGGPRHSLPH
jgi:hypothetical protein